MTAALYLVVWSTVRCPALLWWLPPPARPYACPVKREYLLTEDRGEALLKLQDLGPGGAELGLVLDGAKSRELKPKWSVSLPE